MEKVEVFEVVKVTEEVESCKNQMEAITPKKRKSKAQGDNVEKPKKPRSAYLLYYFDVHQIMQQEIPNLPQSEINKRISESWKRLSVAEKAYYLEKAKSEKEGIDTSSLSPSKDLPGFRKILPRSSYCLLSKGCSSNHQPGGSQLEVSTESVDSPVEGGLSSVSLTQEPQFTPLGLGGEVELSEQPIVVDDISEPRAPNPQGIPPNPSTSVSSKAPASTDTRVSQRSANLTANGIALKGNETRVAGSGFGGATVQQIQGETTQVLAIIPSQNLLEPKSLAGVSSVGPVMMVSVGASIEQSAKPSYKMAKKAQEKEAASKLQKSESKLNESCQPRDPTAQEGNADASKRNTTGSKKEGRAQRCTRKQHAVAAGQPQEGSSTKEQEQTKQLKDSLKCATVQDRSIANVQKRPMRPILPAYYSTGRTLLQILTVPPDKGKFQSASNNKASSVPVESFSGLKPSTLKQLGQAVTTNTSKQDLGLSTARGRGRCKNPSCDYMYKNRHKPAVCPKCGCELTQKNAKGTKSGALLDPYQALSPAQKEIQRQNTLQLLHRSLQIPESETELQETLTLIQELNSLQIVLVQPGDQEREGGIEAETLVESGWPQFYESAATHCGLCNYPLFKGGQSTVAGQEDCWLLTETLIQTASLQLKVCLNVQCLALHSFTDLHPGLFNIGNKLLVSIDLFLKIRARIKLGQHPSQVARTILDHIPNHPVHTLSPEELSQIWELLLSGYWAFECLTVRDYNDMICGICGVAPKLEIAQRYRNNVLELKNVEFTWPEFSVSDEVHVDDFWLTMESEAIEQATFPTDIPITRVDASIIAPFIPPLMRSPTVINTEKDKNELLASLISLYTHVHSGLSTAPQPPPHLTAGRLSKVCPHKVVCGSKYLVRGETARDHVDLLLSSRYWPPVYVSDCARQVALCTDMQYPDLATQMWGRNQGCFSDPFEKPENQQVHPITKSSCCWLVHPPGAAQEPPALPSEHHSMVLCKDLEPYISLMAELEEEKEEEGDKGAEQKEQTDKAENDSTEKSEDCTSVGRVRRQPLVFNNTAYYYLYNRLVDFLTSRDIVSQQINQVVKACQPGEVVIRDALYRLGVAQINTEKEEDEGSGMEGQTQEEGTEMYEVVLPE
ncbi:HMG domain-containing protein 3 [Nibea albiflora]|uniref:HMG domain-containing protein 3 n=1 Tax=Nibea albiflora TaxID=240163 RepID=A0ACB7EQK7_NIBAL|nr:HMG domain-containing protein 3 [Nibea albiflora]